MDQEDKEPFQEQRIEAVKTKQALEALLASEGWHIITTAMEERRRELEQNILHKFLDDSNGVYKQEFQKGRAYELLCITQLPQVEIEQCDQVLSNLPSTEEGEE